MFLLAAIVLLFGLFPGIIVEFVARPAAEALLNWNAYWGMIL
jgi:formate hydrogenlyase subunit 3/multisubunit Na+/H+ antiporter MnhD subunit